MAVTSACMHVPLSQTTPPPPQTPVSLSRWREDSRRDAGMARKVRLGSARVQNFSLHSKVPSFPAHRRRVLVRRGSPPAAAARNIIHLSPCSLALVVTDPLDHPLLDDPRKASWKVTTSNATDVHEVSACCYLAGCTPCITH